MEIGSDGSGIVSRIGATVPHLQPGDRVAFARSGCMRTHVRIDSALVQRLPESMSFAEGAAAPLAMMVAYQSLVEVARVKRGEIVLVHGAAGG